MKQETNLFEQKIKEYLDDFSKKDADFFKKYENSQKTIHGCCMFIISEVQKLKKVAMTDDEVYGLAVHYYDEAELGNNVKEISCKVVVPGHETIVELTEQEKEAARLEAKKIYAENLAKEMEESQRRKAEELRKKALEMENYEEAHQLSLF